MYIYATGHKFSETICKALAAGSQQPLTRPKGRLEGAHSESIALYGLLRGCLEIWELARKDGRNWLYLDNGYVKPGHFDGYYSAAWNAFQHPGTGDFPRGAERAEALGLKLEDWREEGEHILLLPPTEAFAAFHHFTPEEWTDDTVRKLRKYTSREIRIRLKPGSTFKGKTVPAGAPLKEDLEGCHAMVTHNSKATIEALVAGVPVFTTTRNIASALALHDLSKIERPKREGDREKWIRAIAANQWTLEEIKSGQCWRDLREDLNEGRTQMPKPNTPIERFFPD